MSPLSGRPVRETAGGQSALPSGPAPAHRRPTRRRPGRCPSTETPADSTGPAARRSAPTRVELPLPAASAASWRDCVANSARPCANAGPELADRRASRSSASAWLSSGRLGLDHAVAGSAPRTSRSAARLSNRDSCAGAEEAAAAAVRDTGIPEDRHAANTSRLEAAASGSLAMPRTRRRRPVGTTRPAQTRTCGELTVISTAAARSNEARLMTAPDR